MMFLTSSAVDLLSANMGEDRGDISLFVFNVKNMWLRIWSSIDFGYFAL